MVEPGRPPITMWHMGNACWITKATNTHSEYVILIALPLQQWLHERPSMLRYTYIAYLVITETERVYCTVRTGYLNVIVAFKGLGR